MSETEKRLEVWTVIGDSDNTLFSDKLSAEIYARQLFPNDDPYNRYARVMSRRVYEIKEGEQQ